MAALSYFAGGEYEEKKSDPEKKPKGGDPAASDDEKEEGEFEADENSEGSKGEPIQCEVCGMTHPNDGRHESDEAAMAGEGEGENTMGKILEALTTLVKQNETIMKALPGMQAPPKADKDLPVTEDGADPSSIQSKAASEGRLAAVEQVANDLKREKETKAMVAKAMTDLCEYNLGPAAEAKLVEKVLASKEPAKCITDFVEAIKEHGVKMPTAYAASRTAAGGKAFIPPAAAELPEAVREYSAQGPEALEQALKAHDLFMLCKEQGSLTSGLSEKDFIKHRVKPSYGLRIQG